MFDTYRVSVNGVALPPADQLYTTVDVGPYLKRGANTITVEVATTLLNRLRAGDVAYATAARQKYGLIGPVKLTPYGEAPVYARTDTPGTVGGSGPGDALALARRGRRPSARSRRASRSTYTASTTANVISTAGDAALTVSRPRPPDQRHVHASVGTGGEPLQGELDRARSSNDPVTIAFKQHIGATDALRTGDLREDAHVHLVDHDPVESGP